MINLEVIDNFINLAFIRKLEILGKIKAVPELIIYLNRENLGTLLIITKSGLVLIVILRYIKYLNFNIMLTGQYNIVLGILWLRNYNLVIN
jgi:hypothetical protein